MKVLFFNRPIETLSKDIKESGGREAKKKEKKEKPKTQSKRKSERIAKNTSFCKFKNTVDTPIIIGNLDNEVDIKSSSMKKQKIQDCVPDKDETMKQQSKGTAVGKSVVKRKRDNAEDDMPAKVETSKQQQKKNGKSVVKFPVTKWFGLRTRSSPKQLYMAISNLQTKHRVAVKKMGFGKLLEMKMDGIPAKFDHYVVDNFDPESMEIRVQNGAIMVDSDSLHQLLGIPNSGVDLESINPFKNLVPVVASWRLLYESSYISPSEIAARIETSNDDNFNFQLDFILLFLSAMVECHSHDKCKLEILNYFTRGTVFGEIDWCGYLVSCIKKCKNGWKRCTTTSPFKGALAILTLLYVDNITCPGLKVDSKLWPISFWTMNKLRIREGLEIKNGGFGLGERKALTVDILVNEEYETDEEEEKDNENEDFSVQITNAENKFQHICKFKSRLEKDIARMYSQNPENQDIKGLVERFENMFKDKATWQHADREKGENNTAGRDDVAGPGILGDFKCTRAEEVNLK